MPCSSVANVESVKLPSVSCVGQLGAGGTKAAAVKGTERECRGSDDA
jgi:hypothetical protein